MRRFIFAGFALTVLAACQPATSEFTEEQKAEIEIAVRQVVDDMYAGARAVDIERILTHWGQQDGLCVFTTILPCSEVLESYRQAWTTDSEVRLERQEMDGEDIRVMALSPTVALMARTTEENRAYYTNGDVGRARFSTLTVFVLENGEWKAHSALQASWPIEDDDGGEG